ncbi:hypothetical protein ACFPOI_05795 [Nonomuraea angiospora]|uniref:Uncharacterized protein n=1 Tax=Nonomuraea angiospora TaxID=46172 RepID=A0ABR9MC95_9ACTN|nr:hypothetical protein [Nonomuraea angiospora]MBE1590528.1 hypothetical protein [Nonomuraea angiospora]
MLGVAMAAPSLLRRRSPAAALYIVSAVLLLFYALGYPGFPPSVVLASKPTPSGAAVPADLNTAIGRSQPLGGCANSALREIRNGIRR